MKRNHKAGHVTKQYIHTRHTQICSVSWNYLWSINDNSWSNIAAKYLTLNTSIVRLFPAN